MTLTRQNPIYHADAFQYRIAVTKEVIKRVPFIPATKNNLYLYKNKLFYFSNLLFAFFSIFLVHSYECFYYFLFVHFVQKTFIIKFQRLVS